MIWSLVLDVDGVLTNDADGGAPKRFDARDGPGIELLMMQGVTFAIVSRRNSVPLLAHSADLKVAHIHHNFGDKAAAVRTLKVKLDMSRCETAAVAGDLARCDRVAPKLTITDAEPELLVAATHVIGRTTGHNTAPDAARLFLALKHSVPAPRVAASLHG